MPPFQVCVSSTDLAHLPPSEAVPRLVSVPGLRCSDRPGTPTSVRSRSKACHRSRSAYLRQTWHTHPHQKPLQGRPPFQVCASLADLAHLPLSEAAPRQATAPGLHGFDRPGTSTSVRSRSRACHRSRSAYLRQTWHGHPKALIRRSEKEGDITMIRQPETKINT